ncbi:hypothetical protein D3C80_1564800 [compost metagenome]
MRPHPEGETPFKESIKMQLKVIEECSGSIAFIDRYLSEPSTTFLPLLLGGGHGAGGPLKQPSSRQSMVLSSEELPLDNDSNL